VSQKYQKKSYPFYSNNSMFSNTTHHFW